MVALHKNIAKYRSDVVFNSQHNNALFLTKLFKETGERGLGNVLKVKWSACYYCGFLENLDEEEHHTLPGEGGTCQNFDRDAHPIFLGLKFGQILFFWIGKFFSYFSGFHKISTIFLGL